MPRLMTRLVCILLLLVGWSRSAHAFLPNDSAEATRWADSVLNTLTRDERIGQLFIYVVPAVYNATNRENLRRQIEENKIGGILFQKGTIKGQALMTNYAQRTSRIPLFVSMDGEWGLQMRLSDALRFPRKMTMSAMRSDTLISAFADEVGRQCNLMGIHINFDPVLDVNTNPSNPVINIRAWSDNPHIVAKNSYLFLKEMRNHNVLCTAKHFPGHGDTETDSHVALPLVNHDRATIDSIDLYPYRYLLGRGVLDAVMVGHIAVPSIDTSRTPASLSALVSSGLLKDSLGFGGLVVTDAMQMGAVQKRENATVQALTAGADIILDLGSVAATRRGMNEVLKALDDGTLSPEAINEKCLRVLKAKYMTHAIDSHTIDTATIEATINTPQAHSLQQEMGRRSVTVLKNEGEVLPLSGLEKNIVIVSVCKPVDTYFTNRMGLYGKTTLLSLTPENVKDSVHLSLATELLSRADVALFAIHDNLLPDSLIANLAHHARGTVIDVFFLSPYLMSPYVATRDASQAVLIVYENAQCVQYAAAEAIMGGERADGTLPVSVPGTDDSTYQKTRGLETRKCRLSHGTPESVGMRTDILARIDTIVEKAIADTCTPGCQVLVARRGRVVYRKAFGHLIYPDSATTLTTLSTVYDLASVTKMAATTLAVMRLVDEGKIGLDQRVSDYLPYMKHLHDITVRDLLMHQSGLASGQRFYAYAFQTANLSTTQDSIHGLHVADSIWLLTSCRDSIERNLSNLRPVKPRGNDYKYSDLNFILLQRIIERVTKMSLDNYMEQNFYAPLGCHHTCFNPKDKDSTLVIAPTERDDYLRHQLVRGYVHDENAACMGGVGGHAGLFSTADDLATIMQMILDRGTYGGKCYVGDATVETFLAEKSDRSRRGLGFDRQTIPEDPERSSLAERHTMMGHTGFTGTCVWIDPDEELIYIFLSNRVYPKRGVNKLARNNVRTDIAETIYTAIEK